ncbi:sensor histidine kinase [Robbsia andropogonis]|uniref:sensor histidine kinase n=1 Tax=Robbsia andropogonis TaxID=28092 RepID=UPI002A69EB32|nr:ATP-binding protein [Robbsia andropogonis]
MDAIVKTNDERGVVSARLVAMLFDRVFLTQSVAVLLAILLTSISFQEKPREVVGWLFLMITIALWRVLLAARFRHSVNPDVTVWSRYAVVAAAISGMAWSVGIVILTWKTSPAVAMFVPFILAGAVAGAVTTLAPVPSAFVAFALTPLLTLAIVQFFTNTLALRFQVTAAVVLFLLGMLLCARQFYEQIQKAIVLEVRYANEARSHAAARDAALNAANVKSDFLAMISHEIRTPMNGIVGMSSLLAESELSEAQVELANVICASACTLLEIVNDIIDVAKLDNGKLSLARSAFSIRKLLHESVTSLRLKIEEKNIKIGLSIPDDIPAMVMGDERKFRKVIDNVLSNAGKFTEQGRIDVRVEKCGSTENVLWLTFAVIDTGIGIPQNAESILFTPFSQIDVSSTRQQGGIGLGLMICRRLVDAMGGTITYESESGRGSTFYIALPFLQVELHPGATSL